MICTFAWVLTEVALGQKKTLARRDQPSLQIPLRSIPNGMYFLQLRMHDGQLITHKVLVER